MRGRSCADRSIGDWPGCFGGTWGRGIGIRSCVNQFCGRKSRIRVRFLANIISGLLSLQSLSPARAVLLLQFETLQQGAWRFFREVERDSPLNSGARRRRELFQKLVVNRSTHGQGAGDAILGEQRGDSVREQRGQPSALFQLQVVLFTSRQVSKHIARAASFGEAAGLIRHLLSEFLVGGWGTQLIQQFQVWLPVVDSLDHTVGSKQAQVRHDD